MSYGKPLLDGVRVIDLSRVLAAPYCTMMLGDLGADVIKIEAPGRGDDTRGWGPPFTESGESAYFLSANRNKRSVTLNLKSEKGIGILRQLIQSADVLVDNFRVGTLARFGLGDDELESIRPGLIYCTVTGYGYTGPYKDRPGYDFIVQALGGLMSVTGPTDGEPTRTGIAIADLAAGTFACNAILAALFARERTGEGQRIDISLLDSMVALMSYVASNYLVSGELPARYGNGHPNIVPYQAFEASDGYFAFAAGNDRQWAKFCQAVDKPEWASDPEFATNAARVEHRERVAEMLGNLFATRDTAAWLEVCQEIAIPAAPINNLRQVFEDPQVLTRGLRTDAEHPADGTVPLVGSPLRMIGAPPEVRLAPPTLGQHTAEVLGDLGYSQSEIAEMQAAGVV
jgi:crotonobetainyl-CoA:carnitine CoA-transferase CaiB-like acyl-CoA transferase